MNRPAALLTALLLTACGPELSRPPAVSSPAPAAGGSGLSAQATGAWVSGTYTNAYGSRFYRLWVPAGYNGSAARPLMVMLHGCTQDGYDFAAGTRMNVQADARNFLVLYPEQGSAYNGADCWNWFYDVNQRRGSGEPSLIAGMIARVKASYRVDAARVGVAGISAGGAMSSLLACTYPDHVRRVAVVAGLQYRAATTATGSVDAMRNGSLYDPNARGSACAADMGSLRRPMPTLVFHGTADSTVNPLNGTQTLAQFAQTNDLATDGVDNGNVDSVADATATATACRSYTRSDYRDSTNGSVLLRRYVVQGLGHAWPGGSTAGSYSDPCGPDATALIVDFFGF
ncbi:PHB depolymerase family esterase [Deinococcus sp. SDU3-2]|uniref:PHB depolymerase family esterase n=1 Tax=Deinococcus terrestris TaxID=2651870 RepID=A0A7X1NWX7_9DEIO|nr:PHB depolymerase family esterase [Deinococcus terrestris]MPY67342.1 PHB depolymerase family esterase [Deinococcus terrestris]